MDLKMALVSLHWAKNSAHQAFSAVVKHKFKCLAVALMLFIVWSSLNPQAAKNLWLSRDQQATLMFQRGDFANAARTFEQPHWQAVSTYLSGDFGQAAKLFATMPTEQALFSKANALAHLGQYQAAIDIYQSLLVKHPDNKHFKENLELVTSTLLNVKKTPGKKTLSNEIAENASSLEAKKQDGSNKPTPSSQMWLEQVQQNPEKFLRKKFQLEYADESKQ